MPGDPPRDWFRFVTAKAKSEKSAEVYIYGDIGETFWGDGVSAQAFVDQLNELTDVDKLDVRINSPGGSAWDGMTIANAIMRHPAKTTTWIDGLAASAASIVAVAGDEVVVSKYGQAMLHNAHALVMGSAKDMREVAAQLDSLNASMATYYADRAGPGGGDAKAFSRAMEAETWYNAQEMLDAGLASRIDESGVREEVERAVASAMTGTAEQYRYRGRPAAPAPAATMKESQTMATKDDLAKRLGKDPADVTDEDLMTAALEALGPAAPAVPELKPTDPFAPPAPADPAAPEPEPAPAPELVGATAKVGADGTVMLDRGTYESLVAGANAGNKACATLQAQADARVVDTAIDEGRITPARRDHYMALMAKDRVDTADLLTKRLQPGVAVPLHEVGHAADTTPEASVTENPLYQAWKVG